MPLLDAEEAHTFLASRHHGVIVTLKQSDGRPQLSNVAYALLDGRVRVSVTDSRAKVANLRADPRVSLHVSSGDFYTYVVAEGTGELSPISSEPGDATGRALLRLYEEIRLEGHPDHEEFFAAMVADRRLELSFAIERLYPLAQR